MVAPFFNGIFRGVSHQSAYLPVLTSSGILCTAELVSVAPDPCWERSSSYASIIGTPTNRELFESIWVSPYAIPPRIRVLPPWNSFEDEPTNSSNEVPYGLVRVLARIKRKEDVAAVMAYAAELARERIVLTNAA